MRDFFKPWRRKIGVVTLITACVFAAGWVRSCTKSDRIVIHKNGIFAEYLVSQDAGLGWSKEVNFNLISAQVLTDVPYREWWGFKYGQKFVDEGWISKRTVRIAPYWSIVIPLTLFSAWLLVSKPRLPPQAE